MKRKAQALLNKAVGIADAVGTDTTDKSFAEPTVTNALLTAILLTLGAIAVQLDQDEPYGGA